MQNDLLTTNDLSTGMDTCPGLPYGGLLLLDPRVQQDPPATVHTRVDSPYLPPDNHLWCVQSSTPTHTWHHDDCWLGVRGHRVGAKRGLG